MFASFQTVDKVANPLRAIKRNSIRGPRQIENLVGKRSELCKAQETRGSKFTCEFGRNSTVYCFVASDNQYVYYEFQRNSFNHGISFDVS